MSSESAGSEQLQPIPFLVIFNSINKLFYMVENTIDNTKTVYQRRIEGRSFFRYLVGLTVRWLNHKKYQRARRIARKNGAIVSDTAVFPVSLAKKLNANCYIGNHVTIQTDNIDTRSPLRIGNNVIIGQDVRILTASHNIDSPEWDFKTYGLEIEDYVWIATGATILPSCQKLAYGSVVGGASLCYKNTETMDVVCGNPAVFLKKRKCVHSKLVVESLLGGDYAIYRETWKKRNIKGSC